MSMTVHNLMAFNHQFYRPQPVVHTKQQRSDEKAKSFQEVLNEKMKVHNGIKK